MRKQLCPLLLLLTGASAAIVYRPVRMLGLCLAGIGVCILLFRFLGRKEKQSKAARTAKRVLSILLAVGCVCFAALEIYILANDATDETREPSAVIILGAGVYGTEPSVSLRVRLDAALAYLADKPDIPVVVSGGQGNAEDITEAECMRRYLTAHGLDGSRILMEEEARNTRENIDNSLAVLAENGTDTSDNIAVVTADYHLARAGILFAQPNFIPVAAHLPQDYWPLTLNYYVREAFALVRAWILHR